MEVMVASDMTEDNLGNISVRLSTFDDIDDSICQNHLQSGSVHLGK